MKTNPSIFLAFANDKENESEYLRNLSHEVAGIRDVLSQAESDNLCELEFRTDVTADEIFKVFLSKKHKDNITIFHYGGHAASFGLLLENDNRSKSIAYKEGLISFLGRQQSLELVFLNGCGTEKLAEELLDYGVPAVIGTTRNVSDEVAYKLSVQFYESLGAGNSLITAWKDAVDRVKTKYGGEVSDFRNVMLRKEKSGEGADFFPWFFRTKEGMKSVENWNLPTQAGNPYFGLPVAGQETDLPINPYRFLEPYRENDASVFFGRGKKIRELFFKITDNNSSPVILLSGASGVGKSSLLHAGLMPRLKSKQDIIYLSRDGKMSLTNLLFNALCEKNNSKTTENREFSEIWQEIEAKSGNPLSCIIDQAERVFTNLEEDQELDTFLKAIHYTFENPRTRPIGKLIFCYRKEYHSDFVRLYETARIPFDITFLERLDKSEIIEIVNGLASEERLRRKYRTETELGLGEKIANDLLSDSNSTVAPVLQIILTKLWNAQKVEQERKFTSDDYLELKRAGVLLKDFLDEKLQNIAEQNESKLQDYSASGLVLDVLNFHISEQTSSLLRTSTEIRAHYNHRANEIMSVVEFLTKEKLLTRVDKESTVLVHDTLAAVIKSKLRASDKPGQRAARVFNVRQQNYKEISESLIADEDLLIAEVGLHGMRDLSEEENTLLQKSRTAFEKKQLATQKAKRNKRLFVGAIAFFLSTALLVSLSFMSYYQEQSEVSAFTAQAMSQAETNPTVAFQTIQKALTVSSENKSALTARHDIYSQNEFYENEIIVSDAINAVKIIDEKKVLIAYGKNLQMSELTGKEIWTKNQDEEIRTVDYSKEVGRILFAGEEGIVKLADLAGEVIKKQTEHESGITKSIFCKSSTQIFSGDKNGEISLWNLEDNTVKKQFFSAERISDLAYSEETEVYYVVGYDGVVQALDSNFNIVSEFDVTGRALSIAVSSDGMFVAVGSRPGKIYIFDAAGQLITEWKAFQYRVNDLSFSLDGNTILAASDDNQSKLWTTEGDLIKTYKGHQDYVQNVEFFKNQKGFISSSADKSVKIWQLDGKAEILPYQHENEVSDIAISSDGSLLLSATGSAEQAEMDLINDLEVDFESFFMEETSLPKSIFLYNLEKSGQLDSLSEGHEGGLTSVAISAEANLILTSDETGITQIRDIKGKLRNQTIEHRARVSALAISMDGKMFADASYDSTVIVRLTEKPEVEYLTLSHEQEVECLAFSPGKENYLITGQSGNTAILWDATGKEIRRFSESRGGIVSVAFTADGQRILVGDTENTILVYALSGEILQTFTLFGKTKTGAAGLVDIDLSNNGKLVAATSLSGQTIILDLDTGLYRQTIENFNSTKNSSVAFSVDSKYIFVGDERGFIQKYKILD